MRSFDFYRPSDLATAKKALAAAPKAQAKGGGTDLLPLMKEHVIEPPGLVQLYGLKELTGIALDAGRVRIGAATTLADIAESELVQRTGRGLAEAVLDAATPLVRTRATLGGNLCQRPRCWYFRHKDYPCAKKGGEVCFAQLGENKYHAIFDNSPCAIVHPSNAAPALIALDAMIHIESDGGGRDVPASEFWVRDPEDLSKEHILSAGEIVTAISYAPRPGSSAHRSVKEKQSYDWSMASCVARIEHEDGVVSAARIVLQHLAPTPLRREAAEALLIGKRLNEELLLAAGTKAAEGARPLRDNGYKVALVKAVVADAVGLAFARSLEGR